MNHRVIITLRSNVCIGSYATFDGLLGFCAVQEAISKDTLTDFDTCLAAMPLERVYCGDISFPRTSSVFFDPGAPYHITQAYIHRRFNMEKLRIFVPSHKAVVHLGSSIDKNYRLPIYPVLVSKLNFLFDGDEVAIEKLLRKWLPAIGRENQHGYGSIKTIDVVKDTEDPVQYSDTSVRRPVPLEAVSMLGIKKGVGRTAVVAYTPPYPDYHPHRKRICVMPDRERLMGHEIA